MNHGLRAAIVAVGIACAVPLVLAQGSAVDEIENYRQALQDGNPAELWEARGEGLWKPRPARRTRRSRNATSARGRAS